MEEGERWGRRKVGARQVNELKKEAKSEREIEMKRQERKFIHTYLLRNEGFRLRDRRKPPHQSPLQPLT